MHQGAPMSGCLSWLKTRYLQAEVGEGCLSSTREFIIGSWILGKDFARHCEALAIHEI